MRDYTEREKTRKGPSEWDSSRERMKERTRGSQRDRDRDRDRYTSENRKQHQHSSTDVEPGERHRTRTVASDSSQVRSISQQMKDTVLSGGGNMDIIDSRNSERESGELPNTGSRGDEVNLNSDITRRVSIRPSRPSGLESERSTSDSPPRKRKFSPIVWDYDDKLARPSKIAGVTSSVSRPNSGHVGVQAPVHEQQVAGSRSSGVSPGPASTPSPSLSTVGVAGAAPVRDSAKETGSRSSPQSTFSPRNEESLVIGEIGTTSEEERTANGHVEEEGSSLPESIENPEPGQVLADRESPRIDGGDEATAVPVTLAASRWAEGAQTPDREKPFRVDDNRAESGSSTSPEPGEYVREKSEGAHREKSHDSDGSVGQGSMGKDRSSESMEEGEYERELNKRELMELDSESLDGEKDEVQEPEDEVEFEEPSTPPGPQTRAIDMLQGCRSVDEFERLNRIDEGTYGVVYRARNKKTGEIVALKKVKMEKEKDGFPMTSLREINVLLSIHHPSVVDVKEVVVGSTIDSIFMVMEYMEHDLKGLMEAMKQPFSQSEVKCLMLQLFEGTKYLHDNWVLHRDLKTSNLLLNNRGELKICDFGLARQYGSPLKAYSHMVVTLWYRAPELLLGSREYSTPIDMWSLGCIMAEFLAKEPLFNGKSEIDQIDKIFKTLGTPNEKIWPDLVKLPGMKCNFVRQPYNRLREKFPPVAFAGRPTLSESGFNLLNGLLTYDPKKRLTAEEALNHDWFKEVPLPKSKEFMPTFPARSEHDRRLRRLLKSPDPLEEQRKRELRQSELGSGGLFG